MKLLAADVNLGNAYGFGDLGSTTGGAAIPDLISRMLPAAFAIIGVAITFYLLIGAFKILTSGGEKEALKEAREMITHGIVGLILFLFMWLILKFIPEFFGLKISIF